MSPAYHTVLRVEVEHTYFGPGPWGEYHLVPSPATQAFLVRRGFRWASEGTSYTLYVESERLTQSAAQAAWLGSVPATLCFGFETSWQGFGWATPLPGISGEELVVYRALLGTTNQAMEITEDPVVANLRPSRFKLRTADTERPISSVRVFDGAGSIVSAAVERLSDGWRIDLRDQGAGFYQVVPDTGPEAWVVTEPAMAFRKPSLALMVHGLGARLAAWEASSSPPIVRLRFTSRETVWRYHVFNAGRTDDCFGVEPAGSAVAGSIDDGPRFLRVPGIRGLGGGRSVSFEADRSIPLRWRPRQRFHLVKNDEVLVSPLPLPGRELAQGPDRERAWSEMVVTL